MVTLQHFCESSQVVQLPMPVFYSVVLPMSYSVVIFDAVSDSGAGDRLHSLTSRDGDWFLDELACINANLLEYVAMATPPHLSADDSTPSAATSSNQLTEDLQLVISGVNRVYLALQVWDKSVFYCDQVLTAQVHVGHWPR